MIIKKLASLIVLVIIICLHIIITTGKKVSDTRDVEIDRLLKKLNKPAIKSIKSPDGDIIDCVHMKNHPIYDHPLFKNHTIQVLEIFVKFDSKDKKMKPTSYPERWNDEVSITGRYSVTTQLWTNNGKCPKNSIPIRRTRREDILRAKSIEKFGKKNPNNIHQPKPTNPTSANVTHEYAILSMGVNDPLQKFYGTKANINVWKPYVETPSEFSLAQIWVISGTSPSQLNTIEAGWQVYPFLYGDDNTRFFIYWTADGYKTTGCYNTLCEGFVVTNQEFTIGGSLPVSTMDGHQEVVYITIWKDQITRNWWLKLGSHLIVGYWPSSLFNRLQNGATKIDWGGEVLDSRQGSQHTTTKMGSGRFPHEGWKKAGVFTNLEIIDEAYSTRTPESERISYKATNPNCYNVRPAYDPRAGQYFFFGGPGRNHRCR